MEVFFASLPVLILLFSYFKNNKIFVFLLFALLWILAAFRDISVGTDTVNYLANFVWVRDHDVMFTEPGWYWLNKLALFLNGDFGMVLVLSSLLVLLPIYYVISSNSTNAILSIFFYYTSYLYLYSFNITRQCIAVSLVFLAFFFLIRGKKWVSVLFILAASAFHTSALVALPIIVIGYLPKKRGFYLYAVGICFMVGLFFSGPVLFSLINMLGYGIYLQNYSFGNIIGNALYLIVVNTFFFFILNNIKDYENIQFKLFFVFVALTNLLARVPFGDRVLLYFSIIPILFFPYVIYNNKAKQKDLVFLIIIAYSLFTFYRKFGYGEIFPYKNTLIGLL